MVGLAMLNKFFQFLVAELVPAGVQADVGNAMVFKLGEFLREEIGNLNRFLKTSVRIAVFPNCSSQTERRPSMDAVGATTALASA